MKKHTITGRSLGQIPALDGLRAVAALAVLGFHAKIPGFANGDIGVDIFFSLSGFLITSILISRSGPWSPINFRDFYRRRALRLLPAYFAVVAACVVVECFADYGGTFKGAAVSSLYLANWTIAATDTGLGTLGHMWSLSIEEQFYVVWPVLLALLLRRLRWNATAVLAAVAALVLAAWLMIVGLVLVDAPARIASNATPTRAVELLIGGMLAIYIATPGLSGTLARCRAGSGVSAAGVAACGLLLALIPWSGTSESVNSLALWPVIALLTCTVIYASIRAATPLTAPLSGRFMTGVGKRSYGLYLWHFPVLVIIDTRWGLDTWGPRLAGIAVTAIVVLLSYRFIERPFLERKDAPRRTASAPPSRLADARPRPAELPAET
jgi:peptidoglycan/LPS O-acetylase OafA/YrhL